MMFGLCRLGENLLEALRGYAQPTLDGTYGGATAEQDRENRFVHPLDLSYVLRFEYPCRHLIRHNLVIRFRSQAHCIRQLECIFCTEVDLN